MSVHMCDAGKSKQQPWATPSNPGCSHENITVVAGETYRFRIINGGSLLYQTVCFKGHNVTIVAADATPTEPVSFGSCVDVNVGQRCAILMLMQSTHLLSQVAVKGMIWRLLQPPTEPGSFGSGMSQVLRHIYSVLVFSTLLNMRPEALGDKHSLGDCRYDVLPTANASAENYCIKVQPECSRCIWDIWYAFLLALHMGWSAC